MIRTALLALVLLLSVKTPFQRLTAWTEGSFTSDAGDRLTVKRIWSDRKDGVWYYAEGIPSGSAKQTAVQLFCHLTPVNDTLTQCDLFTASAPARFLGAAADPAKLKKLTADSLTQKSACSVVLTAKGDALFAASAPAGNCSGVILRSVSDAELTVDGMASSPIVFRRSSR